MIDLRFRPLKEWPKDQGKLRGVQDHFKTAWPLTLEKLEYELRRLRAANIVIAAGFGLGDLRNDGWPQTGRHPGHPGVILSFVVKEGELRFPCGTFRRYEANLHAIALTLEKLRAIDRYGVTLAHQQYAGFAQLAAAPVHEMTIQEAAGLIIGIARPQNDNASALIGLVIEDPELFNVYFRKAAAQVHPDAIGGDRDRWDQLEIAKAVLRKHHGNGTGG